MEKTAVDIVLLPPLEIMDKALKINRMLNDFSGNKTIVLDKQNCIPHISISMGTLNTAYMVEFYDDLKDIAKKYLPYRAEYKGLAAVKTSENEVVSGIDIIKDDCITDLQNDIKNLLLSYNSGEVTSDMVYPDDKKITEFTLNYSSGYLKNSTGDNFSPHITLGYGDVYDLKNVPVIPSSFECTGIAVCHLGNHCTCKKIIRKYSV